MDKFKKFKVDFTNTEETPFFQVTSNHRIRFDMDLFFNNNTRLLKNILDNLFNQNEKINSSFICGYIINGKRIHEKTGLGKFTKIRNWKETLIKNDNFTSSTIFASIKNLNYQDVYKYCQNVSQGHPSAYISFYNDNYLLYINQDVIDIISFNEKLIEQLKTKYAMEYDKYYE